MKTLKKAMSVSYLSKLSNKMGSSKLSSKKVMKQNKVTFSLRRAGF